MSCASTPPPPPSPHESAGRCKTQRASTPSADIVADLHASRIRAVPRRWDDVWEEARGLQVHNQRKPANERGKNNILVTLLLSA
eukprot:2692235-Rhodomonas_salina.2